MSYSAPVQQRISLAQLSSMSIRCRSADLIPIELPITPRLGILHAPSSVGKLRDETYEVFIDSSLTDGYLTYGSICIRAKPTMSFYFRPTSATPRSPTTTVRAWRCSHILRSGCGLTDAIQLSIPVCTGHDRCDYMARAQ